MINSYANQPAGNDFILPPLPYSEESLENIFSRTTFAYHHQKHHKAYVTTLNNLLKEPQYAKYNHLDLESVILNSHIDSEKPVFNSAAQTWNHTFFWYCLSPVQVVVPDELMEQIEKDFGSYDAWQEAFVKAGLAQFGSGWVWMTFEDGKLSIFSTDNAYVPFCQDRFPILTCDVWEHAYYIDYFNDRKSFLERFCEKLINWSFVYENFLNAR